VNQQQTHPTYDTGTGSRTRATIRICSLKYTIVELTKVVEEVIFNTCSSFYVGRILQIDIQLAPKAYENAKEM